MELSQLKQGQRAEVLAIRGQGDIRRRILEMGVIPGTVIEMRKPAPMKDPLKIFLRNYELSLRIEEASWIEVRVSEDE